MPWRPLRRCLLFGLLGLLISVVVGWGVSLNWQLRSARYSERGLGVAIVGNTTGSVVVSYGVATEREIWQVHKMSERAVLEFAERGEDVLSLYRSITIDRINWGGDRPPLTHDLDARARRRLPIVLSRMSDDEMSAVRYTSGWPCLALRHSFYGEELDISTSRSALPITANWAPRASFAKATGFIFVPLEPRPGLLLNTIFYGVLWALILLAPSAIRRRIRRARGRCPKCGYSLRGQPAPGCPECGHGREAVGKPPQPAAKRQDGPAPA